MAIREIIAVNIEITPEDMMDAPDFAARGGLVSARTLFGDRLRPLLDELPQVLVPRAQTRLWSRSPKMLGARH